MPEFKNRMHTVPLDVKLGDQNILTVWANITEKELVKNRGFSLYFSFNVLLYQNQANQK